jgi:hypothetical protein
LFYTTHYFPSIVMASSFPLITHVANLHKIQVFIGIRKSDHMMFKKQHFIIKLLSLDKNNKIQHFKRKIFKDIRNCFYQNL